MVSMSLGFSSVITAVLIRPGVLCEGSHEFVPRWQSHDGC